MFSATLAALATTAALTTPVPSKAIIMQDQTALRAAARDSAQTQALFWQGEVVEVRGERSDYVQVWDHKRERGGFVRASQIRRLALDAADAPELLAVVRFLRDAGGNEALGIGMAAAWLKAAPAQDLRGVTGTETFDALGTFADRLARRASAGGNLSKSAETALAAHLEVVAGYGVKFVSYEREGKMQICYEGEAFRRVLAMPADPQQQARAALALTRPECVDPNLRSDQRLQLDQWRVQVLEKVDATNLPVWLKNRVAMRRASLYSSLAFQQARQGQAAQAPSQRAIDELASVVKTDLTDDDQPLYNDAAMRVSTIRWAAVPVLAPVTGNRPWIVTQPGQPGETCVLLLDAKHGEKDPLIKRCTYGIVWAQSATVNREGNAVSLAVLPTENWLELWLLRKTSEGWALSVLPPTSSNPELGYIEFAGWVPGGAQMLLAREARAEGKYKHNFEVLKLDSLTPERQSSDPTILGPFQRWQDPQWKRLSVSVR